MANSAALMTKDMTHMHRLRLVMLGLAAAMALALALRPTPQSAPPRPVARVETPAPPTLEPAAPAPAEAPAADPRPALVAAIDAASDYRLFFDRLRLAFPSEYERVARAAAQEGAAFNIDAAVSEAVRGLRQARGLMAARAAGPALSRVFDMQLSVMRALDGQDKRLCVDFLYGGASDGLMAFSARNRALVANLALAGLEAISDGQIAKIERGPASEQDFAALEAALAARGLEKAEIEALLDGRTPEPPLDDARMCRSGQVYLETLGELPEDVRLRIYTLAIELMARG